MTTSERIALQRALEGHPDIKARFPQFWRVKKLEPEDLRNLARSVGVSVAAIQQRVAQTHAPRLPPPPASPEPAFRGTLRFPMRIEVFGTAVTRRARVRWTYTPDWDHVDATTGGIVRGRAEDCSLVAEIMTTTDDDDVLVVGEGRLGRLRMTEWKRLDFLGQGVLPDAVVERVFAMVDEDASAQDRKRRQARGLL